MTAQEPPRCPYCKAFLSLFTGSARQSRIRNAPTDSCVLGCANFECPVELYFVGDEADCNAQANNLALVYRKAEEAVKAERERCCRIICTDCRHDITLIGNMHVANYSNGLYRQRCEAAEIRSNPEPEKGKSDESN